MAVFEIYWKVNPDTGPVALFKSIRRDKLKEFEFVNLTNQHIEQWLQSKRKPNKRQPTPTLSDLLAIDENYVTPWQTLEETIDDLGDDDRICLELVDGPNVVYGRDIRKITGEDKPKQTSNGIQYSFVFPATTKRLMSRVLESRDQIYLKFQKVTADSPVYEELKSLGVALTDGMFNLVASNVIVLLRLITITRNNHKMRIGFAIGSGETSWTGSQTHLALQKLAVILFGLDKNAPYMNWHILDDGAGLTKGIQIFLSKTGLFPLILFFSTDIQQNTQIQAHTHPPQTNFN